MATIQSQIALYDNFSAPMMAVVRAVDMGLSAMDRLRGAMNAPADAEWLDEAREAARSAAVAVKDLDDLMRGLERASQPQIPQPQAPDPVNVPIRWQTDGLDVFTGSGIERFEQEARSANDMLNSLSQTQRRIAAAAGQTDLFPPDAVSDMNNMQSRLTAIQQRIQAIEGNPMNIGSGAANAELERLRGQLSQAVQEQEALNRAVEDMDVEAANQAYLRLSQTVGGAERQIRDNVDAQERFNQEVASGRRNASGLTEALRGVAATYLTARGLMRAVNLSDSVASTRARLSLIVDDGGSVEALEEKIMASAERSRAAYFDTASAIASMGANAGAAFSGNDELIAFMEQVNKQFVIGGATAQGQAAAMLQLTQAMASGALRGEELNSILENAPGIARAIERYMGAAEGSIKKYAEQGEITAEIVKNALFAAADDTNAKFESMPKTFSQIWTSFQNRAVLAFQPVLERLNGLANSAELQAFADGAVAALSKAANFALSILDAAARFGAFVSENWEYVAPAIEVAVAALSAYYGWQIAVRTAEAASRTVKLLAAAAAYMHAGATGAEVSMTAAATAAQYGLNTALYACPLSWIILLVFALAAAFVVLWDTCDGFRNAVIKNWMDLLTGAAYFYNFMVDVINGVRSLWNSMALDARNIGVSVVLAFTYMAQGIVENFDWITDRLRTFIELYNKISGALGGPTLNADVLLDTEGIEGIRDRLVEKINAAYEGVRLDPLQKLDMEKVEGAVGLFGERARDFRFSGLLDSLFGGGAGAPGDGEDPYGYGDALDGIGAQLEEIGDNTRDIVEEDMKYLRDIAEQEAVNRYTVAEISVDMSGMQNNISNGMDLDGVVSGLTDAVGEAVDSIAEGVHD